MAANVRPLHWACRQHTHSEPATMATGTAPKRLRFDLFTEHVDNTHSEPATKWHSPHSILSLPPYQTYESTSAAELRQRMEWRMDFWWQEHGRHRANLQWSSQARLPNGVGGEYMRWIYFNSTEGLWQGEELEESCWHAGKIWPISPGSLKDNVRTQQANAVKTSMRPGNTSNIVFLDELKPSDVLQKAASYRYTSANLLQSRPTGTMDV